MPGTRQNKEIRKKLLEAGVSIFIDQGYHGTGIQEVVDKAGIPKGSFYNYFKSKEDFGSKTIVHFGEQFKEFLEFLGFMGTFYENSLSNLKSSLEK